MHRCAHPLSPQPLADCFNIFGSGPWSRLLMESAQEKALDIRDYSKGLQQRALGRAAPA